jgi:UDP-N-acetylglucosamine diphosphorylase / glucose-1-phosphate thymidylyltransferase / UDP-N-acetylgalactosamine diphosphorylase / glucosamine-1-phosphate N-acetyltransferase / galactosamine-1-phosphate N-acetyltransferase
MSFATSDCWPLSLTREIEDFPIANTMLASHQRRAIGDAIVTPAPRAWLDAADVSRFLASGKTTLVDSENIPLAWTGAAPDCEASFTGSSSFIIRYPWDLLRANELAVSALRQDTIDGEIHPAAVIEGVIFLGQGSRILPGVFIEGNVVIGAHCKVGPNCYIRGHTSIGDHCHIGQSVEIKNSLILSKTNVGHLSYVGDSVLGEGVNFGAGTTISNLRHDGKNHRSMVDGSLIDTGRRKFGVVVGDQVHTGINTSIYPGRKLWPHTSTRPGEIVQRDVQLPIS